MKKRNVLHTVVLVICIAITAASVTNVLLDNREVIDMAQKVACEGKDKCNMSQTGVMRLPVWQTITFNDGKKTVEVRCTRAAIVVGEYSCKVQP